MSDLVAFRFHWHRWRKLSRYRRACRCGVVQQYQYIGWVTVWRPDE